MPRRSSPRRWRPSASRSNGRAARGRSAGQMTIDGHPAALTRLPSVICWATAALVAVYAVVAFIVGPAIYSDSGWGSLIAESMAQGGRFNHVTEPAADDIARDATSFTTLWSPGQYVLPLAFERLGLS